MILAVVIAGAGRWAVCSQHRLCFRGVNWGLVQGQSLWWLQNFGHGGPVRGEPGDQRAPGAHGRASCCQRLAKCSTWWCVHFAPHTYGLASQRCWPLSSGWRASLGCITPCGLYMRPGQPFIASAIILHLCRLMAEPAWSVVHRLPMETVTLNWTAVVLLPKWSGVHGLT
jgi:hypothetical protein